MKEKLIIGAVAGDIAGYHHTCKEPESSDSSLLSEKSDFTCYSVLTVAVMDSLLNGREYISTLQLYGRSYPGRGYGPTFSRWLSQDYPKPYNSWNNGAALRVSPIGYACRTLNEVLDEARRCSEVSHNHPDGIKGAQAVAAAVFLAKNGRNKTEIRDYIESTFGYNLSKSIEEIRPGYFYDQSSEGTVPEAIVAFLDSEDFESAIRLALSLDCKTGSIASITGGISQAYYKEIPDQLLQEVLSRISPEMYKTIYEFSNAYPLSLFH